MSLFHVNVESRTKYQCIARRENPPIDGSKHGPQSEIAGLVDTPAGRGPETVRETRAFVGCSRRIPPWRVWFVADHLIFLFYFILFYFIFNFFAQRVEMWSFPDGTKITTRGCCAAVSSGDWESFFSGAGFAALNLSRCPEHVWMVWMMYDVRCTMWCTGDVCACCV